MNNDHGKSIEEINKEIEAQLIEELENPKEEKKRRQIFSIKGLIMLGFLGAAIFRIVHYFM